MLPVRLSTLYMHVEVVTSPEAVSSGDARAETMVCTMVERAEEAPPREHLPLVNAIKSPQALHRSPSGG